MKAMTMRLTVMCEYCGCPMTYKKIENKLKATEHLHSQCRRLKNLGLKFENLKK